MFFSCFASRPFALVQPRVFFFRCFEDAIKANRQASHKRLSYLQENPNGTYTRKALMNPLSSVRAASAFEDKQLKDLLAKTMVRSVLFSAFAPLVHA